MEFTISDGELERFAEFSRLVDQAQSLEEERQLSLVGGLMTANAVAPT